MSKFFRSFKIKNKKTKKFEFKFKDKINLYAQSSQEELLKEFNLSQFGLSNEQAFKRQDKYGSNYVEANSFKWFRQFIKAYFSPFNIILALISAFNFYQVFSSGDPISDHIPDFSGAIIVFLMIVFSGSFTYLQAIRANYVAKKLLKFISRKAVAIRDLKGSVKKITAENEFELIKYGTEINADDLVPGDIIYLTNGDIIPGDVRILVSNNFVINQSSLTGESSPVHKGTKATSGKEMFDLENICLMGTNVVSGSAIAMVVGTGIHSYLASVSQTINQNRPSTAFDRGIRSVTLVLICFMLALTPIIFLVDALLKDGFGNAAVLYAVAAAVGLTPEMMPAIVTTNLARGATKMSNNKIVTKNLSSIQNLGAIDVLCTDKTGTITNDNIELVGCQTVDKKNDDDLLLFLYLNSYFQTGLKNPIDSAVVSYFDKNNINLPVDLYEKIHEVPFDFDRRKLTVVVKSKLNDSVIVVTKGAAEEIIDDCKFINYQGEIVPLDSSLLRQVRANVEKLNSQGLRLVALAYKKTDSLPEAEDMIKTLEDDLVFYGFASFLDTPKASAAGMIKSLGYYGVDLKILTGDNEQVTRAVCKRIHLHITGVISGKEIENMSEEELSKAVEKNNIFVKLSPLQKADVIKALRNNNHVVGYMGDGINDGPVLRQSDVAISVNNATDMVKEVSDLILLEKSLSVIEDGVVQGRTVFANILKYIKITLASQFGNVFSILVSLFWLKFEPMIPIQMLFQNLIYDFSQFAIAFDRVDKSFIKKPQRWSTRDFLPFAFINGPVSSIFDMITFAVMLYVYHIPNISNLSTISPSQFATFNAGWFIEGIITQTWVVQMFRTEKIPFIQSRAPFVVNFMTVIVTLLAFLIPYVPSIADKFSMHTPSYWFILIVLGIIISYCVLSQYVKTLYIKVFKKWL